MLLFRWGGGNGRRRVVYGARSLIGITHTSQTSSRKKNYISSFCPSSKAPAPAPETPLHKQVKVGHGIV